jgi:molecular chaperone DnaK (HSP70)
MNGWALDLGTTNTGLAGWDSGADSPRLIELPSVCRKPGRTDPLEAARLIPSATHLLAADGFWDQLGRMSFFLKRAFWGKQAEIGRQALELNEAWVHPQFAPSFKKLLGYAPHRTVARIRGDTVSARQVARTFMRELFHEAKKATGERIRDVVFTVPVESYDQYRAELSMLCDDLGVERVRFIDEPVAAAIGYGLGLKGSQRRVLVVDYGGGTLDLAVVELTPRDTEIGQCRVIAKAGRPIGGNVVDQWLLDAFAQRMKVPLDPELNEEHALWHRLMMDEARRVKEAVYFSETATFALSPPETLRSVRHRIGAEACYLDVTRQQVLEELTSRGMYEMLNDSVDELETQLTQLGTSEGEIDDVLMVGGSTLLPMVFKTFEDRFGRDRVRAWQPFEAVAFGAACYSANRFAQSDFLVHDYAILITDPQTNEKSAVTIVEHGTRFPTQPDHWSKSLVPTCALGEPQTEFALVICEVSGRGSSRKFGWDAEGQVHRLGAGEDDVLIVPLNESSPTLGLLDPPHPPGDRRPRLNVSFGVNENRWLVATIKDLKSGKLMMDGEPVVRLL